MRKFIKSINLKIKVTVVVLGTAIGGWFYMNSGKVSTGVTKGNDTIIHKVDTLFKDSLK